MNDKKIENIDPDFCFGLSLQYGPETWDTVFQSDYPIEYFPAVEFTGQLLESIKNETFTNRFNFRRVHLVEIIPTSVSGSIADQPEKLIDNFIDQFNSIITSSQRLNIDSVSIDFSLDSSIEHQQRHRNRIRLLKRLTPILNKTGIRLCLPIRIPFTSPETAEYFFSFLSETMCPDLRFSADIHPHELGREFAPENLLRWLRFDTEKIRFIYEPEIGNQLVTKLISPWIEYFELISYRGSVIFSPTISSAEYFLKEAEHLHQLKLLGKKTHDKLY